MSPASLVTGWVGVRVGGAAWVVSSGGSFHYAGSLAAAGVSPPVGPERGGTRVAVAVQGGRGVGVGEGSANSTPCVWTEPSFG